MPVRQACRKRVQISAFYGKPAGFFFGIQTNLPGSGIVLPCIMIVAGPLSDKMADQLFYLPEFQQEAIMPIKGAYFPVACSGDKFSK